MTNKSEIVKLAIKSSKAKLMSITFKKMNGAMRTITFNPLTAKGIVGDAASDAAKQAVATRKANNPYLVSVCDQSLLAKGDDAKKCWRSVNLETVTQIKVNGIVIKVEG